MVRLKQLTVKTKRYQRKVARITRANDRHQGTARRKRTKGELAAQGKVTSARNKYTHVCHNRAHHISKAIAQDTPLIGVVEHMKKANLIRAPIRNIKAHTTCISIVSYSKTKCKLDGMKDYKSKGLSGNG